MNINNNIIYFYDMADIIAENINARSAVTINSQL